MSKPCAWHHSFLPFVAPFEKHDAEAAEALARAPIRSAHRSRMKMMFDRLADED